MRKELPIYPIDQRIKFFREKKGITVNKLATLAGLSQSRLRDIELEQKNPNIETIYLICQALNISLKEFFDDESTMYRFNEDPIFERIYKLDDKQRKCLLNFLDTIV